VAPDLGAVAPDLLEDLAHPLAPAVDGSEWPPLRGVRIVEVATYAAGPGAACLLAGLGAEVLKVEPPEGDPFRRIGFTFIGVNRGKRGLVLDLARPGQRAELDALLDSADVFVHNVRHSSREEFGVTAERLASRHPGLLRCVVEGFGRTGPDVALPAIDVVLEALSGGPLVQGGDAPTGYDGGLVDNTAALLAALGVAAGLYAARCGTGGQQVELSLLGATMHRHCEHLVRPLSHWDPAEYPPDPVGPSPGHRLYRAADGWLMLAAPDAELPADLESELAGRSLADGLGWLRAAGLACAPALTTGEFLLHAAAAGDPVVERFEDPGRGTLLAAGRLADFGGRPWPKLGPAPGLATGEAVS
jgi:crotonobetainyl-CoA:carnitine CoA-transferase CaiB-like acyl-CoA transferase